MEIIRTLFVFLYWGAILLFLVERRKIVLNKFRDLGLERSEADHILVLLFVGSIYLLWTALFNHYPLVFSDTNTYLIANSFKDRAAGYAVFLRLTSLGLSLWLTVFVQSLITACLLMRISCIMLGETKFSEYWALAIITGVIALTDVSKFVSLIMPDITASWLFLGVALFYLSYKWYDNILSVIAFLTALFCHYANMLTLLGLLPVICVALFCCKDQYPKLWVKTKTFLIIVFLILFSVCALNFSIDRDFTLFPAQKGNFAFAKFTSFGFLSPALDEYCAEANKDNIFCYLKKELKYINGHDIEQIIWVDKSPLKRYGLFKHPREINDLNSIMLKRNRSTIIRRSISDTFELLFSFDSYNGVETVKTPIAAYAIKRNFTWEYPSFHVDNQVRGKAILRVIPFGNEVYGPLIWSLIIILSLLAMAKIDQRIAPLCLGLFLFIFLHDFITASTSGVFARYNLCVLWLIPYTCLLAITISINKFFILKRSNI